MRLTRKVRSTRSALVAGAVVVALASGGLAYGSGADRDPNSTTGAPGGKAAPAGTVQAGGTATMTGKPGVKQSGAVPKGSTADRRAPADRTTPGKAVVDRTDKGRKGARVTKDRGTRHAPATRDLGR